MLMILVLMEQEIYMLLLLQHLMIKVETEAS